MKNIRKIGIVSLCLLALSGCTSGNVEPTIEGMQLSPMASENLNDKIEKIDSNSSSSTFVFTTGINAEIIMTGSSSCPPRITKVLEKDSGLDIYVMKPVEGKACTADIKYYGWAGLFSDMETAKNTTFSRVIIGEDPFTDDIKAADFERIPPK